MDLGEEGCSGLLELAKHVAIPLVVNHLGRAPASGAPRELTSLLERGHCWIKLSAPYRLRSVDGRV